MKGITFLLHRVYKAADAVKSPTEVQQQRRQETVAFINTGNMFCAAQIRENVINS